MAVGVAVWVYYRRPGRGAAVLSPEYMRMKKNPVNIGLQGFLLSPSVGVLPEVVWRQVVALEVAPASGACHARSSKKTLKKPKSGGSQTPQSVARGFICRLD